MKLSQRLDIVVLVLVILYVLTGCTITLTTDPNNLEPCAQWTDVQMTDRKCTLPAYGAERICVYEPYITTVCVARESSS